MVYWLNENRGWSLDLFDGISINSNYLKDFNRTDSFEFRSNIDLIECVDYIKKEHKHETWSEEYYCYECNHLSIVEFEISPYIEHYNDGHERLKVEIIRILNG